MNYPKLFLIPFGILLIAGVSVFGQCPSITVIGPAGITEPGVEMKFRAEVGGGAPRLKYSWGVSSGTIVNGQGTPEVTVSTDKSMGGANVTATVEIGGLGSECSKTASETAPLNDPPAWCWDLDSYGRLKPNDERVRLDSFFVELLNNPTQIGLIVFRITSGERADWRNPRIQFVLKHARFRKFDRSRLLFALEHAESQVTIPVRIVPGGEMPPCTDCVIIKGGDLH